jgi:hypothetical protein
MATVPPECRGLDAEVKGVQADIKGFQEDLHSAAPGEKPWLIQQINKLNSELRIKKKQLEDCIRKHTTPPTPPKPDPCQSIQGEIKSLEAERNSLAEDLKQAGPSQKSPIVVRIMGINEQIRRETIRYRQCRVAHGGKPTLATVLSGRATITTSNQYARGPFTQTLTVGLLFHQWEHKDYNVTSFPDISIGPYDLPDPLSDNTTTITWVGGAGGRFNPASGEMDMRIGFHVHHSNDLISDSDITFIFQNWPSPPGSPMSSAGAVTMFGVSAFQGGRLDGDSCTVTMVGTVSPHP